MKHFNILLFFLLLTTAAYSQVLPTVLSVDRTRGAGGSGASQGTAVAYDTAGNMYIAGFFYGEFNPDNTGATSDYILTSTAGQDGYIAKYTKTGTLVWAFNVGGVADDQTRSIAVDDSGYIYIGGITGYNSSTAAIDLDPSSAVNTVTPLANTTNSFLAKYDGKLTPANVAFCKWAYGWVDQAAAVINLARIGVDDSGYIYTTGASATGMIVSRFNGHILPTNPSFKTWEFNIAGGIATGFTSNAFFVKDLTVDSAANVYVTGWMYGNASSTPVDMDPSSNTNTISAVSTTQISSTPTTLFAAKYNGRRMPTDPAFYKWAFAAGPNILDAAAVSNAIAVDDSGYVYIGGSTNNGANMDMDPSSNTNNMQGYHGGNSDMVVAKYDGKLTPFSTSFYKWAFVAGGSNDDRVNAITADNSGSVYITGDTYSTGSMMDPVNSTTTSISTPGGASIFLAMYNGSLPATNSSFYKWGFRVSPGGSGYGLATNGKQLYFTGNLAGTHSEDVDPSTNVHNLNASGTPILGLMYDATKMPTDPAFYQAGFTAGNANPFPVANATAMDTLGNTYICGNMSEAHMVFGSGSNTKTLFSNGGQDFYVAKYDPAYNLVWAFNAGKLGFDAASKIAVDNKGYVYVTGYINDTVDLDPSANVHRIPGSPATNDKTIFLAKYNGNLNASDPAFYQWAFSILGTGTDLANSLAIDSKGNVYITGSITSSSGLNIDMDPSANTNNLSFSATQGTDIFAAKYNGNVDPSSTSFYQWAFAVGGSGADLAKDIALDTNGNVFLTGTITGTTATNIDMDPSNITNNMTGASATSSADIFVAKYDGKQLPSSASFYKWAFSLGVTKADQANSIVTDDSGNVYIGGFLGGLKGGNLTPDVDPSVNTNTVTLAPGTNTLTAVNNIFLAKYNGNLTPTDVAFYKWAFAVGTVNASQVSSIDVDHNNNIYIAGTVVGTTVYDMDPSVNTNTIASSGASSDIFIARYATNLTPADPAFYKWAFTVGGPSAEAINDLACTRNIFSIGGYFNSGATGTPGLIDFQPGANSFPVGSAANGTVSSAFVAKYSIAALITNTVIGSPFCSGSNVNVPFLAAGTYNSGNVFTAQLSNATGSFAAPVNIGTLTGTTSGTITATIPVGTPAGTGYRIRVTSSNVPDVSDDNGINLIVSSSGTPAVVITVSPDTVICAGGSVQFTATATFPGNAPNYVWKKGATTVGTNSATYTDNSLVDGNTITVVMTSNATCAISTVPVTSNAIKMTVKPLVTPAVTITANPGDSVCIGTLVTFTAAPTNPGIAPSYAWKKGPASVGVNSPIYSDAGLTRGDVITVTMTSNANCLANATPVVSNGITMKVDTLAIPTVTVAVAPNDTICAGRLATFTATPTFPGTTPFYQWKRGAAIVPGTNGPTFSSASLSNNDVISCVMTSSITSCIAKTTVTSNNVTMTIDPANVPVVTITANPGTLIAPGQSVTFTATVTNGGAPTYQWKKNNQNVGTNSATYTDNPADNDVITCYVHGSLSCAPDSTPSNSLTIQINTGVGTLAAVGNISLYPNPNKGAFTLQGTVGANVDNVNIDIVNTVGQVVYQAIANTPNGSLNKEITLPDNCVNGIYQLRLSAGGNTSVSRFVIVK